MMETDSTTYRFLEGGGEMGALMRSYGWSRSPLGPPVQWPQSLRTVVDLILHSQVPMLLWWGDELIQFYNDAYRPSLGENGKHPRALGQAAKECWPESWHIITPLIDRVRNGGRVWSEDRQIPICRNGKIEDGYWTFGYSPVRDESGSIAG
ncbi:MAG TPA: PAS domain-containing sensor histidine kinase, partial [Chryseosolibacter sp.]